MKFTAGIYTLVVEDAVHVHAQSHRVPVRVIVHENVVDHVAETERGEIDQRIAKVVINWTKNEMTQIIVKNDKERKKIYLTFATQHT